MKHDSSSFILYLFNCVCYGWFTSWKYLNFALYYLSKIKVFYYSLENFVRLVLDILNREKSCFWNVFSALIFLTKNNSFKKRTLAGFLKERFWFTRSFTCKFRFLLRSRQSVNQHSCPHYSIFVAQNCQTVLWNFNFSCSLILVEYKRFNIDTKHWKHSMKQNYL